MQFARLLLVIDRFSVCNMVLTLYIVFHYTIYHVCVIDRFTINHVSFSVNRFTVCHLPLFYKAHFALPRVFLLQVALHFVSCPCVARIPSEHETLRYQ